MLALPSIVRALLDPYAYPERPEKVELVQTQMSFILLAGSYVYKIKKPVNLGYLDYTTLVKRRFFCDQELRLNRRLCPAAYLAVVSVVEKDGQIRVEQEGEPVEYAVKMKRLPQERMMDLLLPRGEVTRSMVRKVAEKLVNFHETAETNQEIAAFGRLGVIRQNWNENFAQTEKYIGFSISKTSYERIKSYADDFMKKNADCFDRRVADGRIRDCHGDLHAAHVCFTQEICIYDCIEFNDRFRFCDVASEIAFLAMDTDRYQRPALSRHLVDEYIAMSGDEDLLKLLNFYKCYRAYVRGKVESFKLGDPYVPEQDKARVLTAARIYFQLAESYI